ncbi:MAG: tetratricopeptide repeat protein [Planctomycetes bacterium]|nr:tetratricopeptide repeat protein [Planctomycetota bacterium]
MADIGTILEQGIERHRSGDLSAAEALYRQVLETSPEHWDAMYLLGTSLLQCSRFDECVTLLSRVVTARPDVPDAHNNLGVAYQALGQWEQAAKAFQAALHVKPDYDQALFNLGALMEDRKLFADAEKCFRQAINQNPNDRQTRVSLGNVLKAQGKWEEAEICYREVPAHGTQDLDLHINFAYVLARQEKLDEAATLYQEVLDTQPDYYQVHNSLSYVYERQGQLDAAVTSAKRALEIKPDFSEGYNNLGTAERSLHRFENACRSFEKALEPADDFPLAEFNLGTTKLLEGKFLEGWAGYERRAETLDTPPRTFAQKRWDGKPVTGKTLLVYSDQGFGDAIQFARFLHEAQQRSGAKLIFECQSELKPLLENHPAVDDLILEGESLPNFDVQIPLTSLPALFQIELDTIPADVPYLTTPSSPRDELQSLLNEASPTQLKVGFVWQGNPQQARDIIRSCSLETFRPLFELEGIAPFSLQTGEAADQIESFRTQHTLIDLGSQLQDFAETAAVIAKLDLVITVDTATAHLAGALGAPVWTLLCHTPDWRWLLDRDDSPWYPSMRLFRQPKWGDWDSVIAKIALELKNLISEKM